MADYDPNIPKSVDQMNDHELLVGIYRSVTTVRTIVVVILVLAVVGGVAAVILNNGSGY